MITDRETHYLLLHLRTMEVRHVVDLPPEPRVLGPILDKSHASSPIHFDRITEKQAMASMLNGYFISRHAVDSSGSLEAQLKAARVSRVVTPVDFNYEYRAEWEENSLLCSKCGNKYPRDEEHWHHNKYSRDGLRTDACRYCRNPEQAAAIAQKRAA